MNAYTCAYMHIYLYFKQKPLKDKPKTNNNGSLKWKGRTVEHREKIISGDS